ncbi:MAG: serine protease [Deltaproteobacteria bacterium]|jgi:serine protease Do|nr:serine protease [Deltaproteobacteria bacterium]
MKFMKPHIVLAVGLLLTLAIPASAFALTPAEVYRRTSDAVVLILASHERGGRSKGTGSVVAPGRVLTNAHVVQDDAGNNSKRILVFLREDNRNDDSRRSYEKGRVARVLRSNPDLDLALLEVQGLPDLAPIPLGNSKQMQIGDPVLAIGHPENGGLWSLTSGRIGSVIRNHGKIRGRHVFQTETSLNRGNSGGPLLNESGLLVGINTSIARKAKDGLAITGVNFSVQSNVARDWLTRAGLKLPAAPAVVPEDNAVAGIRRTQEAETSQVSTSKPPESTVVQPQPLTEEGLLTKPRPFKDKDLFSLFMSEQNSAFNKLMEKQDSNFDQLMKEQEDTFDEDMDKAFDSF